MPIDHSKINRFLSATYDGQNYFIDLATLVIHDGIAMASILDKEKEFMYYGSITKFTTKL